MVDRDLITATEAEWRAARARMKRLGAQSAVLAGLLICVGSVVASTVAARLAHGQADHVVTGALMALAAVPIATVIWWRVDRQQRLSNRLTATLRRQLQNAIDEVERENGHREIQARRQQFERRVGTGLDMAGDEAGAVEVVVRAMAVAVPDVDSPDACPAARRTQLQRFPDSEALDACPHLRGRSQGRCGAVCVPVSILGRTVGVVHTVTATGQLPSTEVEHDLTTLAELTGRRIGLLRVMAESQLQASTDSLTGLLNRRSMDRRVAELRRTHPGPVAVVLADLDHSKVLNHTLGHETGDRALRLFADTLTRTLRQHDLVSRHGGEEFVAVLPGCTPSQAAAVFGGLREALTGAALDHGLPGFTCSLGVAAVEPGEDFAEALARADVALFHAKRTGRDRTVLHDALDVVTPRALRAAADSA